MTKTLSCILAIVLFFTCFGQSTNNRLIIDSKSSQLLPYEVYYCDGQEFSLKVNANSKSTNDYSVAEVANLNIADGSNFVPFADKKGNNRFSQPLDIGFDFEFFGNTYRQLVVGSNGRILFTNSSERNQLSNPQEYEDKVHSANDASSKNIHLPSETYNQIYKNSDKKLLAAQIFVGFTEISYLPDDYDAIKFRKNVNYQGVNGILISFDNLRELKTNYNGIIKSQLLLLKDGRYFISILRRNTPPTSENAQNAIIGAQNETGTRAVWPKNNEPDSPYNNGKWSTVSGLHFEFTPNGRLRPQITWLRNGTKVSSSDQYTFTPNQPSEKIAVQVVYFDEAGKQVGKEEQSEIVFKKTPKVEISDPDYSSGCGKPAIIKIINPNSSLKYEWYESSHPEQKIGEGENIQIGNGNYFAKAVNPSGVSCETSETKSVKIDSVLPAFLFENHTFYESGTTQTKNMDLASLVDYLASENYDVQFMENGKSIASNVQLNAGEKRKFVIQVSTREGVSPSCTFEGTFYVEYQKIYEDKTQVLQICDIGGKWTVNDYIEWNARINNEDAQGYTIKLYKDKNKENELSEIELLDGQKFYAVWTKENYKFQIVRTVEVKYNEVTAQQPKTQLPPQCANKEETFDLESLIKEVNPSPDVIVTFHLSKEDALTGKKTIRNLKYRSGMGDTILYIRVQDKNTNCVAKNIPQITLTVYPRPKRKKPDIGLKNCEGNTIFNLEQNLSGLVDEDKDQKFRLEYYDEKDIQLDDDEIKNYDASLHGLKPYIKLIYNPTCSDVIPFNLGYITLPKPIKKEFYVCDNSISLEQLRSEMFPQLLEIQLSTEEGKPLPSIITLPTLPYSLKIRVGENNSDCFDIETITFNKGIPTELKKSQVDFEQCDQDFDGKTAFNLDDVRSEFTDDSSATFEYYLDANYTQKIASNFTNTVAFSQTIYVKIISLDHCPSYGEILLHVHIPTQSKLLLEKYPICYGATVEVQVEENYASIRWNGGSQGSSVNKRLFDKAGEYSVTLTDEKGCSYTQKFEISDANQPIINQIKQDDARIEVVASGGTGFLEYSFDGGKTWQTSPILLQPKEARYTIQVRSNLGQDGYCYGAPKSIYYIKISNVITPNGDGKNDTWTIPYLNQMKDVEIMIADRYGKLVFHSKDASQLVWDGHYNGRVLPSATYWYVAKWYDPSTLKNEVRQGWIVLINRN